MAQKIRFTKMHGLGNDFVVINAIEMPFNLTAQQIAKMGNRYTGIGFDQMLVILPRDAIINKDHSGAHPVDFCYQIYNQDGSAVGNCGNGVRCFGRYVFERGLTDKKHLHIQTNTARMVLEIGDADQVKVDMAEPDFNLSSLPCLLNNSALISYNLPDFKYTFGLVSMGNPHAVIVVDDLMSLDIAIPAQFLQNHVIFPEGVNVGFMQIISRTEIKLRVYERGAGETNACGTGACAAVAIGIRQGLLDTEVTVGLKGGALTVCWDKQGSLYMTGPASFVFDGEIDLGVLD